jgi:multidrug efflux pump subunit AcrB
LSDAARRKGGLRAVIGRIVGWSLRSRGVVVVLAAAVFLTLPTALVGAWSPSWPGGGVLSLGSLVGLVLVLAVAARNAILRIGRCQQLARGQDAPTGSGLVMGAAAERLSPILLTAVAIALAVAPLAARGAIPGHEIFQPMAVAVFGGLVTATLLSLFVIPAPST